MMATPGKFSARVEVSHYTLGGLPDVDPRLPYFYPFGGDLSRRARRHESGAVLAALGAYLWALSTQSGCCLPSAGRRGFVRRRGATLWCGPGLWALGDPHARARVATGGPAGRPVARPSV